MTTDDLIASLSHDVRPVPRFPVGGRLAIGLAAGAAVSLLLIAATLGFRPDLWLAMQGGRFWMKWGYTASLSAAACFAMLRLARPDPGSLRRLWWIVVPVAGLVTIGVGELRATPRGEWLAMWLGQSWRLCPWLVLALAMPVFVGLLWSFRRLAPTRLRAAGAAAGAGGGGDRGDGLLPSLPRSVGDLRADLVFARHPAGGGDRRIGRAAVAALVM